MSKLGSGFDVRTLFCSSNDSYPKLIDNQPLVDKLEPSGTARSDDGFDVRTLFCSHSEPYPVTVDNHTFTNKKLEVAGTKHDNNKPRLSLIPKEFIEGVGQAFTYGANKYGTHNYRNGLAVSRTLDAALRHLVAFANGEDIDSESGLSHLSHAGASIAMTMFTLANKEGLDDRYKKS